MSYTPGWPVDQYGRPWPVDQYGRPWPMDPYGRPHSPYLPPPPLQQEPPSAGPTDPRLYRGAPRTLVAAVAREGVTGRRVKISTWGLWDPAIGLVMWFVLGIIGGVAALAAEDSGSTVAGLAMIVAVVLPWIALIGWPALITWVRGNGPFIDLGVRWKWRDLGLGIAFGVGSVVVAVLLAMLTESLFGEFDSAAGELAEDLAGNKPVFVLFLLTVVIGAPIAEEFFFRGLLFGTIAKKGAHPAWAVVGSAFVFAAIHLEPVRMILLFGIGIVLGLARWLTGSTTTSMVAHLVNNLVSSLTLIGDLFS